MVGLPTLLSLLPTSTSSSLSPLSQPSSSSTSHTCHSLFTITNTSTSAFHPAWSPSLHHPTTSPPTTQYYRSLAALLPPLVSYDSGGDSPRLVRSSRIDEGGTLPFVPCTIMPYHTSSSVTACFTHRLAAHTSFYIHFMGDSKVRELFYAFLERTDNILHYKIKLGVRHGIRFVDYVMFCWGGFYVPFCSSVRSNNT